MHMVIKNVRRFLLETIPYNSLIQKFQTLHDISFRYIFLGGGGAGEGRVTQEQGIDVSTMQKGVIV